MPYRKYKAKKCFVNGIKFDSHKEAERYLYLLDQQKLGLISNLQLQVHFPLIPAQKLDTPRNVKGKNQFSERATEYVADFVYTKAGKTVVEDTKGVRTPEYVIKRKLMKYLKGIEIKEV